MNSPLLADAADQCARLSAAESGATSLPVITYGDLNTQQNSRYFFHQLVLHILFKLLCNDILFMHRPSMFSVLLQFKDLIC